MVIALFAIIVIVVRQTPPDNTDSAATTADSSAVTSDSLSLTSIDDDRGLRPVALAVLGCDNIADDANLFAIVQRWLDDLRQRLRFCDLSLTAFLQPGTVTKPLAIGFARAALLHHGPSIVTALLLSLMAQQTELATDAAKLLPDLLRRSDADLRPFYGHILAHLPSSVLSAEWFLAPLLVNSADWLGGGMTAPGLDAFWDEFQSNCGPHAMMAVSVHSAGFVLPQPWVRRFLDIVVRVLDQVQHDEAASVADVFGRLPLEHRIEFLAEFMYRAYGPQAMIRILFSERYSSTCMNTDRFSNARAAIQVMRLLEPYTVKQSVKYQLVQPIVQRMTLDEARRCRLSMEVFLRSGWNWQVYVAVGYLHYQLLARKDFHCLYEEVRSPNEAFQIALALSSANVRFAESNCLQHDIALYHSSDPALKADSLLQTSLQACSQLNSSSPQLQLIAHLLIQSWTEMIEYRDFVESIAFSNVLGSFLERSMALALAIFNCADSTPEKAEFLLDFLQVALDCQILNFDDLQSLRLTLWSVLYAEDQAEIRRHRPDLFGRWQTRSELTDADYLKFQDRLRDDPCCICHESLLNDGDNQAAAEIDLKPLDEALDGPQRVYKLPCGQHFVHKGCVDHYLPTLHLRRCEKCFICRESIPRGAGA